MADGSPGVANLEEEEARTKVSKTFVLVLAGTVLILLAPCPTSEQAGCAQKVGRVHSWDS